jgi:hypothetical protein
MPCEHSRVRLPENSDIRLLKINTSSEKQPDDRLKSKRLEIVRGNSGTLGGNSFFAGGFGLAKR